MNLRHAAALAVGALLVVGCANPAQVSQQQAVSCDTGPTSQLTYFEGQTKPRACIDYSVAEMERLNAEDKKREAEQHQKAEDKARAKLFAESPTGSERVFLHDLAVMKTLTPTQWDAIRDRANKVDLTADEEKALASVTKDQRHSLSQLVAFFVWLDDQEKQAQQAAEQAREQQEQEQEAARLAAYQALVAQAAQSQTQANAAEQALAAQQRAQQNDIWHSLAAMAERQQAQAAATRALQQQNLPTRTTCMNVGETVSCRSY
jgi:hypothetical protein